jgi:hypothetical protein
MTCFRVPSVISFHRSFATHDVIVHMPLGVPIPDFPMQRSRSDPTAVITSRNRIAISEFLMHCVLDISYDPRRFAVRRSVLDISYPDLIQIWFLSNGCDYFAKSHFAISEFLMHCVLDISYPDPRNSDATCPLLTSLMVRHMLNTATCHSDSLIVCA